MKYRYKCKHCEVETVAEQLLRCPICGSWEFSYQPYVEKMLSDWNNINSVKLSEFDQFVKAIWVCSHCPFGQYRFENDRLQFACKNIGCDVDDITGGPVQFEQTWQRIKEKGPNDSD